MGSDCIQWTVYFLPCHSVTFTLECILILLCFMHMERNRLGWWRQLAEFLSLGRKNWYFEALIVHVLDTDVVLCLSIQSGLRHDCICLMTDKNTLAADEVKQNIAKNNYCCGCDYNFSLSLEWTNLYVNPILFKPQGKKWQHIFSTHYCIII